MFPFQEKNNRQRTYERILAYRECINFFTDNKHDNYNIFTKQTYHKVL